MNYNWEIIGDKIFGIARGRGYATSMFDAEGMKTMDPHDATRFLISIPSTDPQLDSFDVLVSLHNKDASSHMDIKSPDIKNDADFDRLVALKNSLQTNVGDLEGLSVNWYKFDHDIDARDDAVNNIKESRDISKPFGTTKSSYQMIGDSKLIIRHTDPVNEEKKGSRWRHIKNIFIETKIGERFAYPHAHIAGARAMARHLSNSGSTSDDIGRAIYEMSEDYVSLKKAARMLRRSMPEMASSVGLAIQKLNKESKRLSGSRGYARGVEMLGEGDTQADDSAIDEISKRMHEACGCQHDDGQDSKSLRTAARHVAMLGPDVMDESNGKPHLWRSRDIDLFRDAGDGYWIGSMTHDDDDVRKVDLTLYHMEDPAGLDDQFANAWREVGFIDVSPYNPRSEDIDAKVAALKDRDRGTAGTVDPDIARIEELAGISG